jgi:acetylornithine deacetylase/succinyl-diaminopimelate desuccinylase-like protein
VEQYDVALVFEPDGSVTHKPKNYEVKNLVVSRKGLLVGRLEAKASGGHSGALTEKDQRHSAIHELVYQAEKIKRLADYDKGSTTNVGTFEADTGEFNILAQTAAIEFDARMRTKAEYDRLVDAFQNLNQDKDDDAVDLRFKLEFDAVPVEFTQGNKDLLGFAQEHVGAELGVTVKPEHRGGGSDMSRFFYYKPDLAMLDNLGPIGSGEHTFSEFVYLDSLEPNIKFSTALISSILKDYKK